MRGELAKLEREGRRDMKTTRIGRWTSGRRIACVMVLVGTALISPVGSSVAGQWTETGGVGPAFMIPLFP
jgi:hypothetical protein